MLIHLTGVLGTGDNPGRRLPSNARTALRLTQTATVTVQLAAFDSGGPPLDLAGADLVLSVGRRPSDLPIILKPGVLDLQAGPNVANFYFVPADTKPDLVPSGRYIYDVWMTVAGVRDILIPSSPFVIEPTTGRP
jgi:hypothetical protein